MSSELEAALFESEQERETLLDFLYMIPVGLARLDAEGGIVLANPELTRLMQTVTPGGGMANLFDFLDPLAPELRATARDFAASAGNVFEDARALVCVAACPIAALSCTLIKVSGGGFLAVMRDATETTQRERELARARELLELSQRVAHVGHYRIDVATETVVLSDELFRICGREPRPGPLKLAEFSGWAHPDDLAAGNALAAPGLRVRQQRWEDIRFVRPDGAVCEALGWWQSERDARGAEIAITGVFIDVTERKLFEREQIRLRDAAEQASRAKSDFLGVMSHELRTPMSGVLGMNALLLETTLDSGQQSMAEAVQQSAQALLGILDDVLEVSRLGAGKVELKPSEFGLQPLVRSVADLFGATAAAKGLRLTQDCAGLGADGFSGDAGRLRQILVNFVSNAVKFTQTGGVTIAVREASASDGRAALRFEISDTGIGVSDEAKARLFKPFVQADSSITRRFGGSGLGLSISHGLVKLMGGACGVADRPGGGSIFWFEIALPRKAVPASPEAAPASVGAGSILVVEDGEVNAEFARLVLRAAGFEVSIAVDGVEAVEAARARRFDLILMDMHMPRMDGLAATRAIRALASASALTPIIGITANGLPEAARMCRDAGMNDCLVKPIPPVRLRAAAVRWAGAAKA